MTVTRKASNLSDENFLAEFNDAMVMMMIIMWGDNVLVEMTGKSDTFCLIFHEKIY